MKDVLFLISYSERREHISETKVNTTLYYPEVGISLPKELIFLPSRLRAEEALPRHGRTVPNGVPGGGGPSARPVQNGLPVLPSKGYALELRISLGRINGDFV